MNVCLLLGSGRMRSPEPITLLEETPRQYTPQDLVAAKSLAELSKVYDALVERGHNNELFLIYTTRMFQLSGEQQ
jgi:hypothetical protein